MYSWPKPVRRPHPPIYVDGTSRAAMRRVCTLGDGWLPPAGLAVDEILTGRKWLADNGRPDVPITVYGAGRDTETLAGYAHAGVDVAALALASLPESAALRELDGLANLAESLGT